ncbi:helix-turn-helix domain-containing protein [Pseudonocardia lacus]|uniref:helix-turn-helix domain-containing protein n=1 Tax=Pseudonocardia lacus TaxID=2835865 RepID=UPI001BDC6602|nr:helix-turn-helix domain-containing protein [Pseudonocardia lacus]
MGSGEVADTWTLRQCPAAERPAALRHEISRTHLPWDLDVDRDADPRAGATVTARTLDDLRLVDCTTGACAGRRGRAEIAATPVEHLGVLVVLGGREHVEQDDHRVVLRAGQALVWSSARPVRFVVPGPLRKRTLLVPRARFAARAPQHLTVLDGPASRLLVEHLGAVSAVGDLTGPAAAAAATAALELLAAALPDGAPDDAGGLSWERVRDHIEERLGDPDLRPRTIAAAHAVSLRTLYGVFERRGETVSGYVRRRRLARARADLARSGPATTVAEIAHRWGFADQAAFGRAFRRQYGCPPSAVRGRA